MTKTTRVIDIERVIHGNKVKTDFIAAPFTQIRDEQGNPRKIPDLENNLKASCGVERITFNSLKKLDKEFGINGEVVSEVGRDSRIRFVGEWARKSTTSGVLISPSTSSEDFIEVTFYGTGLNFLIQDQASRDVRISIDGGPETGNIMIPSVSQILVGKSYAANQVGNATPIPLTLGIHTVKIRSVSVVNPANFYGFEVLNESTQLIVNAGQPFVGGLAAQLDTQTLMDLSPAAITGTKGGRVLTYITEEGVTGQAVTEVDVTPQYVGATDHSNEEVVRTINFREFGANRADDFSTLAGIDDVAFTLNDGTTTLVGDGVSGFSNGLEWGLNPSHITLTFVGTGLDIVARGEFTTLWHTTDVIVDGVNEGTISGNSGDTERTIKLASGLAYGTHTVKLLIGTINVTDMRVSDFIVYQPKKPTLPENAIEIADYNVMADFVANTITGLETISIGVLRKTNIREMVYVNGTGGASDWGIVGGGPLPTTNQAFEISSDRLNAYIEYTFYGTGLDFRWRVFSNRTTDASITIDGNALTAANFPTASFNTYGTGISFNSGTGSLDMADASDQPGGGFAVSGLPLGTHTIKINNNVTSTQMPIDSIDIITPIHINSKDLKTGSLSLQDLRRDNEIENEAKSKIDLSKAKAWMYYDMANNTILSSYNVSAVLSVNPGVSQVYFKIPFKNENYVISTSSTNAVIRTGSVGQEHTTNTFRLVNTDYAGVAQNAIVMFVAFGELENEENIDLGDL